MADDAGVTPAHARVELGLLGPVVATVDGAPVNLGGPRQRAVVARLALARGAAVAIDALVDAVWGDDPPADALASLHPFVSHLRRTLQPGVPARSADGVLVSTPGGYALRLVGDDVDAWRFERLVREAVALVEAGPARAAGLLDDALRLWRGPALAEYRDLPWAAAEANRLTQLRDVAREHLLAARLGSGDAALLVPELEAAVAEEPLREERWRLLALALYRAGRQGDALAALRRARQTLADELGMDPGPALRALEADVLAHAATLDAPTTPAPLGTPEPATPPPGGSIAGSVPRVDEPGLVERDAELAELTGALDAALAGDGTFALLTGPGGIGKSRLLGAIRRRAAGAGAVVAVARASELEQQFPFGVVRQLFEPLLADPDVRVAALSGAAAGAERVFDDVPVDGDDGSFATLHALHWLTVSLAARAPLVIVVDDVHWADNGSIRFLAYLQRRLHGLRVLVVAARRTGEPEPLADVLDALAQDPATVVLAPAPLTRGAVTALVRGTAGDADADDEFCRACAEVTRGNPLLVRQLLRALQAEGITADRRHVDAVRAIGSRAFGSMLGLRLRRLEPEARRVARALSALGDGTSLPLVAALAEVSEPQAARAVEQLSVAEVVRPEPPLAFVHPLLREAVYTQLTPGDRELLHDRAARLLVATGAPDEQVAAQLLPASRAGRPEVVALLRRAASDAVRRGAPDAAVALLQRALDEPAGQAERPDVVAELAAAQEPVDGYTALDHWLTAYETLADPARRALAAESAARLLFFMGLRGEATRFALTAAAALPPGDADRRQGLVAIARHAGFIHALPVDSWGGADLRPSGDGVGARMLAIARAWEDMCAARPAEAVRATTLAALLDLDGELLRADVGVWWIIGVYLLELTDHDVAGMWDDALATQLRRGSLFGVAATMMWRAFTLLRRGELVEAEDSLRTGLEQVRLWETRRPPPGPGTEPRGVGPFAVAKLVRAVLEQGRVDEARALCDAEPVRWRFADGGRWFTEAEAEVCLAEGRPQEALRLLDVADAMSPSVRNPVWRRSRLLRVPALLAVGRCDEAAAVADEVVGVALAWGAPTTVGEALTLKGVARDDEAVLRAAVATLAPTPARLLHAKALCALGEHLVADGRAAEAAGPLTGAYELADACAAGPTRDRAARALTAAGAPAPSAPSRRVLTSTEQRVAQLLAQGHDARSIAHRLLLTPGLADSYVERVRTAIARS